MDLPPGDPPVALDGLPFLVTHWLANFGSGNGGSSEDNEERRHAIERIRNAGAEIASAFSTLGAFGVTRPPSLSGRHSFMNNSGPRNATYSDIRRRWSGLPSSHLEHLAQAVASTNAVVEENVTSVTNLLEAVTEERERATQNRGRTSEEAIVLGEETSASPNHNDNNKELDSSLMPNILSIMQPPSLVTTAGTSNIAKPNTSSLESEDFVATLVPLKARSTFVEVGQLTATTMRRLLNLRERIEGTQREIQSAQSSIEKQAANVQALDEKYRQLCLRSAGMTEMLEVSDEVKTGKKECERVTAQLQRKLESLTPTLENDLEQISKMETQVQELEIRQKGAARTSRDPYWSWPEKLAPQSRIGANPILKTIIGRQQGWSRPRNPSCPLRSSVLGGQKPAHFVATRQALLATRLSHAATINAHISYPVYCLRFDRTGRYFISGADDYLLKVFHLGSGQSCQNRNPRDGSRLARNNYGANLRGAVLVCSLRGHAGVINDIDVSSDNAFLATASVDGDVRVWGLKDGSPVAILRGHKDGANMVSWSKLTPYRLISTGSDGFARIWDIREACLKRYGAQVGKRPEYCLKLTAQEKTEIQIQEGSISPGEGTEIPAEGSTPGPNGTNVGDQNQSETLGANQELPGLIVPPLPAAVPPLPGDAMAAGVGGNNGQGENIAPGQFVANDEMDEGVKLLRKFKHGSSGPEIVGPGTRARRATVNVICVARCPLGLYFATGSDDGICRVFEDQEDGRVQVVDGRDSQCRVTPIALGSAGKAVTRENPVLKLMGHVSAITDLSYSSVGDKILSASQKDGVVRIWTIGSPRMVEKGESGISQIVIKLVDPKSLSSRDRHQTSRRVHGGSNRSDAIKVSCDVALWTHDDANIITSQSVLVKQSGSEIQPGSQHIFLWDSNTGQCLLGISGAHTMQCPLVVPHPTNSSLVCTAGADGIAKLWDWQSGKCMFSHTNKVEFGPVEAGEKGKTAGYLDGSFNADGTTLVLTDDSGRLTILDINTIDDDDSKRGVKPWMQEQYFGNDYYELVYDTNGYCIERGSERPPHLAPRGVRCDHSGAPCSDDVNEAFSKIVGPTPLPVNICRWQRSEIRRRSAAALVGCGRDEGRQMKIRRVTREFDPLTTILIKGPGAINTEPSQKAPLRTPVETRTSNQAPRINESENFRYLDYDDMMRLQGNQDDDEPDSDDEEFSPTARNRVASNNSDEDSDNDDMDLDDELEIEQSSLSRSNRNRTNQSVARQQRSRRRSQPRDIDFLDLGSEDELDEQIMSTNNTPSGPFASDYIEKGHFWRMTSNNFRNMWLKRVESDTSYEGRKIYTPQLGDSLIYIPRAHYETLQKFPSLEPPWQHWPQGTAWPVVRCCVRGARFRFPYQDYYRSSNHKSIVAILTLEVTGIPELSANREFPWPKPEFIESTTGFVFELSVFENDDCEYVLPEGLYTERLAALEGALRDRPDPFGLGVSAYFAPARGREDSEMESSLGQIEALIPEEESSSDPHMTGSGFGVIRVDFGDGWVDDFSPWDLCMADLSISRPQLSEADKKLVLEKLDVQCRNNEVAQHFNLGVDTSRYCDYERMIEVEMYLMAVKRRLQKDYYSSKFAVIQDLRLIKENCIKYNGNEHELVRIAKRMCEEFESSLLSEEEASFLSECDTLTLSRDRRAENRRAPRIRINLRQRTSRVSANQHLPNQLRSSRQARLQTLSSLENLPAPPEAAPTGIRVSRRGRTRATQNSDNPRSGGGHGRSLRARNFSNLDSLSRVGGSRSDITGGNAESRSARYARRQSSGEDIIDGTSIGNAIRGQARVEARSLPSRRATRASLTGPVYADIDNSDVDDIGEEISRPRRASRGVRSSSRTAPRMYEDDEAKSESEVNEEDADEEGDAEEEEDDDSDEDPVPQNTGRRESARASSRSSSRSRRNVSRVHRSIEQESAEESEEENFHGANPRGSTRTSARSQSRSGSNGRSSRSRRSSQTLSPASANEEHSDFEPHNEGSDDELDSPRGRKRKVTSYVELPSDYDDDEVRSFDDKEIDDSSDDEVAARKKSTSKRKRGASPRRSPAKKPKEAKVEKISLKAFPIIPLRYITRVSKVFLRKVSAEDTDDVFASPVLESFPEIKDEYLAVVDEPMDLRTIEEERVPEYRTIRQLQKDLCLMFDNCCQFNGADSVLGQYAIKIRNRINILMVETCEEEEVPTGRWSPS